RQAWVGGGVVVNARHRISGRHHTTDAFEILPVSAPPGAPAPGVFPPPGPVPPPAVVQPPGAVPAAAPTGPATERGLPAPPAQPRRRLGPVRTIRARLAIILVVPTLLLVGLAGVGVANQLRTTRDASVVSD